MALSALLFWRERKPAPSIPLPGGEVGGRGNTSDMQRTRRPEGSSQTPREDPMRRVLVVDDEANIRDVVQYALERDGFEVQCVDNGQDALDKVAEGGFSLVVLDVMMPGIDGLEVCRRLQGTGLPILFLSARSEELDRVLGLELGGDDYLAKPFSPRELVARVKAILRRYERSAPPVEAPPQHSHGALVIDKERHEVRWHNERLKLTATEFGVLCALFERPGIVLSRGQLMRQAYSFDNHVTERTIDTHVRRIRAKFREVGADPIATVHGVGYKASLDAQ